MMRDSWMRAGDAFVLVFDVTSMDSLAELDDLVSTLQRVKDVDSCVDKVPVVIVANKCDMTAERRAIGTEEASERSKKLGCRYLEASAKDNWGVKEAFELAVREHWRIDALKNGDRPPS